MKILLAEDDINLGKLLSMLLKKQNITVNWVQDGEAAYDAVYADGYDVLVLDWMMPLLSGLDLCKRLREEDYQGKILLLTAKDTLADKVQGLNSGADDYLVKPFAFAELMARVRAMTRKAAGNSHNVYTVADLVLDTGSKKVTRGGNDISLSAKEFALLELLMRNKGIVLSRDKIENSIWNFDYEGGTNAVDVYIRYLRKKVDEGYSCKLIYTVRGSGYVLREPEDA